MPPDAASGTAAGAPLLVEIFTEELPPRALKRLGDALSPELERSYLERLLDLR